MEASCSRAPPECRGVLFSLVVSGGVEAARLGSRNLAGGGDERPLRRSEYDKNTSVGGSDKKGSRGVFGGKVLHGDPDSCGVLSMLLCPEKSRKSSCKLFAARGLRA